MKPETPQELMRLVQQGDDEAFRELVRRYREPITAFTMRMLNDYEKAVDVAQETFINVFTHAGGYRPMASFSGWIYRIAHNLAINEIRRRKREPSFSIDTTAPGDPDGSSRFEPKDERLSAEERVLGEEQREVVRRSVATLPPKYRSAIVMKDMEGMTFEEIATVIGCPESTVKSRVMRARRMLRDRLERFMDAEPAEAPRHSSARPFRPTPREGTGNS